MGLSYSTPCNIPSSNDAKLLSDSVNDKKYKKRYNQCTYKISKAIANGENCTLCEFLGDKYTNMLRNQDYYAEWIVDDWDHIDPVNNLFVSWDK